MIELKNISAGYGKDIVINDVSVAFEKGKLASVIGVNRCGKSTLLKAILDMISLSGGEITIDRNTLGNMTRNEIARKAAYLAQGTDYVLLDEPTTYLDIIHQLELMKTLRTLADKSMFV